MFREQGKKKKNCTCSAHHCTHMLRIYMEITSLRARSGSSLTALHSVSVHSSVGVHSDKKQHGVNVVFCERIPQYIYSLSHLPSKSSIVFSSLVTDLSPNSARVSAWGRKTAKPNYPDVINTFILQQQPTDKLYVKMFPHTESWVIYSGSGVTILKPLANTNIKSLQFSMVHECFLLKNVSSFTINSFCGLSQWQTKKLKGCC